MRRLRLLIASTCILIGFFYLYISHQSRLPESYRIRLPYTGAPDYEDQNPALKVAPEGHEVADGEAAKLKIPVKGADNERITGVEELPPAVPEEGKDTVAKGDGKDAGNGKVDGNENEAPLADSNVSPQPPPQILPTESQAIHLDAPPEPAPDATIPDAAPSPSPSHEVSYPFQNDLDLDLPEDLFKTYAHHHPHLYVPPLIRTPQFPKPYAYATFMATRNPSLHDPYYLAIHSLIYRLLWSPRSRTTQYPFIVYVANFVPQEQRDLLAGAGAVVRELAPLEWKPDVEGVFPRWLDLFAKLNMWAETEFERLIFLDADAFPIANLDPMFDLVSPTDCIKDKLSPDDHLADGTAVCEPYIFAGVPQNPADPVDPNINVGSMLFTPSTRMHQRLVQNYVKMDKYNPKMAEQSFLNWQFSPSGAFPSAMLERQWGGFFPQGDEEGKLNIVHEKLWSLQPGDKDWLVKEWEDGWKEMLLFYAGAEFPAFREADGKAV